MAKLRELPLKNAPRLLLLAFPKAELERATLIHDQLHRLGLYIQHFDDALALFEFCESEVYRARAIRDTARAELKGNSPQEEIEIIQAYMANKEYPSSWVRIAVRDAALTIQDFAVTLYAIRNGINNCPTLKAHVAESELREVSSLFVKYFPNVKRIRHAAAHPAEVRNTPERNAFSGAFNDYGVKKAGLGGGLAVSGSYMGPFEISTSGPDGGLILSGVHGKDVVFTIEKQIVSYEISQQTYEKLLEVQQKLYAAIKPAEQAVVDMYEREVGK